MAPGTSLDRRAVETARPAAEHAGNDFYSFCGSTGQPHAGHGQIQRSVSAEIIFLDKETQNY